MKFKRLSNRSLFRLTKTAFSNNKCYQTNYEQIILTCNTCDHISVKPKVQHVVQAVHKPLTTEESPTHGQAIAPVRKELSNSQWRGRPDSPQIVFLYVIREGTLLVETR